MARLAVTRWREDGTRDCWGTFIYLRETATGEFGPVTYQPTLRPSEHVRGDLCGGGRVSTATRESSRSGRRSAFRRSTMWSCGG